jgi:hypothetical protein
MVLKTTIESRFAVVDLAGEAAGIEVLGRGGGDIDGGDAGGDGRALDGRGTVEP